MNPGMTMSRQGPVYKGRPPFRSVEIGAQYQGTRRHGRKSPRPGSLHRPGEDEGSTDRRAVQVVEGIEGRWALVTCRNITGYVFDGFLSRLRAPKKGCESHEEYFTDHFESAKNTEERVEGGEGMEQKIIELAFSNGAAVRHQETTYWTDDPAWTHSAYTIPGINRVEEGFLLLRLLDYIDAGFGFPPRSGRAGTNSDGAAVRAMVYKKNNEIQSLELDFRQPYFSTDKTNDYTEPWIAIRKKGTGIIIEINNMKRSRRGGKRSAVQAMAPYCSHGSRKPCPPPLAARDTCSW